MQMQVQTECTASSALNAIGRSGAGYGVIGQLSTYAKRVGLKPQHFTGDIEAEFYIVTAVASVNSLVAAKVTIPRGTVALLNEDIDKCEQTLSAIVS